MSDFYTDTIVPDPRFASPNLVNDPLLLEPVMRSKVMSVIADAHAQGVEFMIYETYRSLQRQLQLFNQGKSKLKNVGVHHYGLACDIVKNKNGQPSWDGDFSLLGKLGKKYGLIWGGDWGNPNVRHTFLDLDHVQRCAVGDQPGLFALSWYPDDNYNPYTVLPQALVSLSVQKTGNKIAVKIPAKKKQKTKGAKDQSKKTTKVAKNKTAKARAAEVSKKKAKVKGAKKQKPARLKKKKAAKKSAKKR